MGKITKKERGLIAWLCAFMMMFTAFMTAAPLEILAQEYGVDDWFRVPLKPGDKIQGRGSGVWWVQLKECDDQPCGKTIVRDYEYYVLPSHQCTKEGWQFDHWEFSQRAYDDGYIIKAVCTEIPPEEGGSTAASEQAEQQGESAEQIFLRKWAEQITNPDNYLTSITLSDGTEVRSALPVVSKAHTDIGFIVPGETADAERAFGKTESANQIVLTYGASLCGEAMRASVSQLATAVGADTAAIVELQAQERTKAGYALVRDIGTVSDPGVPYQFALNDTLRQALAQGRTILILQYADEPGIFLFPEITALTADTITIRTPYPTGTFAFLIL